MHLRASTGGWDCRVWDLRTIPVGGFLPRDGGCEEMGAGVGVAKESVVVDVEEVVKAKPVGGQCHR